MANNYEQATVQPSIPAKLVSPLERALLSGYGFNYERDGDSLYFFVENSTSNEFFGELDPALVRADESPLGKSVRAHLLKAGHDLSGDTVIEDLPDSVCTWTEIFRGILNKPENCGKEAIEDIAVMAALTCDKLRPGEFGGWVVRITPKRIQYDDTYSILDGWRKRDLARNKRKTKPASKK